ncbi:Uncharacterised protein [Mycobacteroides abscessus subsp. massiliense]|nr:Uncharacterised protein [Mycobacteroides abscessus subsp. massiliense]SKH44560.1 Uncharacterised protein [Mycobacteroides abscessus subsp. massiliense]SKJ94972.1 Uncharacterised protein [Mycobacteroides abscessus subsp. massiliense]SKK00101.1 Uncharacterised protein [Mycobacteroides abscessus subsp. massiliense]SKL25781.1 Uncharacterised protein [Mycobacteroides abscessus subsp. massiliense]
MLAAYGASRTFAGSTGCISLIFSRFGILEHLLRKLALIP